MKLLPRLLAPLAALAAAAPAGEPVTFARQTDRAILAATETLLERHRAGGIQALIRAIETRLADEPDEDEIIALVDGTRRIVAGNLESAPAETTLKWFELEILRKPANSTARVLRVPTFSPSWTGRRGQSLGLQTSRTP
jgi:hypothetical protein